MKDKDLASALARLSQEIEGFRKNSKVITITYTHTLFRHWFDIRWEAKE